MNDKVFQGLDWSVRILPPWMTRKCRQVRTGIVSPNKCLVVLLSILNGLTPLGTISKRRRGEVPGFLMAGHLKQTPP